MTIKDLWTFAQQYIFTGQAAAVLICVLSMIQIAPIKINPWGWLFKWIGEKMMGTLREDIERLEKKVSDVQAEAVQRDVASMRWFILSFAQDCRDGVTHSKEQWTHALNQAKVYEAYCEKYEVQNGVIVEDTRYIRDLYAELSRAHKI